MLRHQKGFGIPELLIGITIGLIVVAAAMTLMQVTLRNSGDNIKMARLEQDLRQAMQMISRDLRRAGWWDASMDVARVSIVSPLKLSATSGAATLSSVDEGALDSIGAMAEGGTLIHVDSDGVVHRATIGDYDSDAETYDVTLTGTWPDYVTESEGIREGAWNIIRPEAVITLDTTNKNCILIAYDSNLDGTLAAGEFFGFKLDTTDKVLEMRSSGATTNTCDSGGTWQELTDKNFIEVTAFQVTDNSPATVTTTNNLTIAIREYTITITGNLKGNTGIARTLRETIKVRNDRII